jgi:hypothetical protein
MTAMDAAWLIIFLACSFAGWALALAWAIDHESRKRERDGR